MRDILCGHAVWIAELTERAFVGTFREDLGGHGRT